MISDGLSLEMSDDKTLLLDLTQELKSPLTIEALDGTSGE